MTRAWPDHSLLRRINSWDLLGAPAGTFQNTIIACALACCFAFFARVALACAFVAWPCSRRWWVPRFLYRAAPSPGVVLRMRQLLRLSSWLALFSFASWASCTKAKVSGFALLSVQNNNNNNNMSRRRSPITCGRSPVTGGRSPAASHLWLLVAANPLPLPAAGITLALPGGGSARSTSRQRQLAT